MCLSLKIRKYMYKTSIHRGVLYISMIRLQFNCFFNGHWCIIHNFLVLFIADKSIKLLHMK